MKGSKSGGKRKSKRHFVTTKMHKLERCLDFALALSEDHRLSISERGKALDIYTMLSYAWSFIGAQCKHWNGFKRKRSGKLYCNICGKPKGSPVDDYVLTAGSAKKIGRYLREPKKNFDKKSDAILVDDSIEFHGAKLHVKINGSYPHRLLGITGRMAADRRCELFDEGYVAEISRYSVGFRTPSEKANDKQFMANLEELPKRVLKRFPLIVHFNKHFEITELSYIRVKGK
jgi:hypothetical protein